MTVEILPVSEICEVAAGGTPSRANEAFWGGDIPWVKISDMLQGQIRGTEEAITPLGLQHSSAKLFPPGTLLLSIFATIGRTATLKIPAATNQAIAGLQVRDPDRVDSAYLRRYLENLAPKLADRARGVAQANINLSILRSTEIPLPPIPEQRRIAAILDKADTLRAKRREAIAKLDQLLQSVFLDMFGEFSEVPEAWARVPLHALCERPTDIKCGPFGTQLSKAEFTSDGVPLWGIKNVNANFELPTKEFVAPETAARLSGYSLEVGDIVMTRKGTIGNCAIYPATFPSGIMHSDLLRIRVSTARCVPKFLVHQLHLSRDVERQLKLISGGAVMPGINVSKLKELEVVLPTVEMQRRFAQICTEVERQERIHQENLAGHDVLCKSLQHRAFNGLL